MKYRLDNIEIDVIIERKKIKNIYFRIKEDLKLYVSCGYLCSDKYIEKLLIQFSNLPNFRLRTRHMKTRWGVCNKSSMTVTLNTELIHKDISLIDYVIIHELCHFKYMDHSKSFWNEVEKYYPYYKLARKRLK